MHITHTLLISPPNGVLQEAAFHYFGLGEDDGVLWGLAVLFC